MVTNNELVNGRSRELRGRIAELKAMATCAARGWEISLPFHLINCAYDISIRRDNAEGWIKVQIKRGWWDAKMQRFLADLRNTDKKEYNSNDVDVFMVWTPETDTWWFIPHTELDGQTRVTLSDEKFNKFMLPGESLI